MGMATQMACTLRGLSSPVLQESKGKISSSRSAMPVMSLCSPLIKNGISFSSSCQLLQSSQIFILQATRARTQERRGVSVGVRCEQSTEGGNSLDIWLGRIAMLSFAAAITIEVTTGKGVLQNIGLTSPLPTVSLALVTVVGVLVAFLIFRSGSKD